MKKFLDHIDFIEKNVGCPKWCFYATPGVEVLMNTSAIGFMVTKDAWTGPFRKNTPRRGKNWPRFPIHPL